MPSGVASPAASTLLSDLLLIPPRQRQGFYATLAPSDLAALFTAASRDLGSPYGLYQDDPVGFIRNVLHETLWSKQEEVAESVEANRRTTVPACHSASKTHLAGRLVAWFGAVWPVGTARVITTATKERQVKLLLWPHIRRVVERGQLPGRCDVMQWVVDGTVVAYGFSPSDYDETAFSGIHDPHVLAVVDEAGGISPVLGESVESLMSGLHARLLLIGNPPIDEEMASPFFEESTTSPLYNVVRIAASDTPNFTGEHTAPCGTCPPSVPRHPLSDHLVTRQWVEDSITSHGEESRYVEARVRARFPKGGPRKAIPATWIEDAVENPDPLWTTTIIHHAAGEANANSTDVAGTILDAIREAERLSRQTGTWVRLGVDVAADGGDEFVIARTVGHTTADRKVRVKIDAIGVGWAIAGTVKAWGSEGLHSAEVTAVNVAERALEPELYANQRAEMWWNGRNLLEPVAGRQALRLDVDRETQAQLGRPTAGYDTSGRLRIQKKADIKSKGQASPDRAEAVLLSLYEPETFAPARSMGDRIAGGRI